MIARRSLIALAALLVAAACGPAPSEGCTMLGARETLDEAIARAAEGSVICLPVGEVAAPLAPIARSITLRGSRDASGALASSITGGIEGCALATGVETGVARYPTIDASGVIVTEGAGTIVLEDVELRACTYGVVARAARTELVRVRIDSVHVATLVDRDATIDVEGGDLMAGTRRPDGSGPSLAVGVLAASGASVALDGVNLDGGGSGYGIRGMPRDLLVVDGTMGALSFGLAIDDRTDASRVVMVTGTTFSDLTPFVITGAPALTGNILAGGTATIENATIEGSGDGSFGLQLEDVESATVRGCTFRGHDQFALALFGGALAIEGGTRIEVPAAPPGAFAFGVVSSQHPTSMRAGALTFSPVADALASTGATGTIHVLAQDGGAVDAAGAGVMLMDGQVGVLGVGSGAATLVGASFVVTGASTAAVAARGTSTFSLDGLVLSPGDEGVGVVTEEGSSTSATGVSITGGRIGIEAEDVAQLTVDGGTITGASVTGVFVTSTEGGSIVRTTMIDGVGTGIVVEGTGAQLSVDGASILHTVDAGAEARDDATLTVLHTRIEDAHGAGIAFTDADGFIAGSMITRTGLRADGRADDVRVVSTDGGAHSVEVGEDGDGVVTSGDQNFFVVDPARTCAGQCSVLLTDGVGAEMIVRPNCLTGDATASADVFTLADQNGGAFTVPVAVTWTAMFAGSASGLGFVPGAPATVLGIGAPAVPPTAARALPPDP